MKRKFDLKRSLSLLLALAMVLSMSTGALALEPEKAVSGESVAEAVTEFVEAGLAKEEVPADAVSDETPEVPLGEEVLEVVIPEGTEPDEVPEALVAGDEVAESPVIEDGEPAVADIVESFTAKLAATYALANELHVANGKGNDATGDGSTAKPFLSIGGALAAAEAEGRTRVTIVLDTNVESSSELKFDSGMDVTIKSGNARRSVVYVGTKPIGNESGFIKVVSGTVAFDNVVLSGSQADPANKPSGRVVYVANGGEVVLNDVTVTNGSVTNANNYRGGSAVFADEGGKAVLTGDTKVSGNYTTGGGAIYVAAGGTVVLEGDVAVTDNESAIGGGIYAATQDASVSGGLSVSGSVAITGNKATEGQGSGMYVEKNANATVSGDVAIRDNKANGKQDNVFLADGETEGVIATLDITGTTTGASIGISAETEYAYRLVSLPVDGYGIQPTKSGDEKGWSDDGGSWDIRYMTYDGVPGLYLCWKSVDAVFNGVDTLEKLEAADINGETADYLNDDMPAVTKSGGKLTAESIVLKDGEDYVVTLTVDPTEYRLPTKDVVKVRVDGEEIEFGYDNYGDPEGSKLTVTVPAAAIEGAEDSVEFDLAAEKLYDLAITMNGPLFVLSGEGIVDNRFGIGSLDLSESVKTGTEAKYQLTRKGKGVKGVTVTLYASSGNPAGSAVTGEDGVAAFSGLKEDENYYIVATYSETVKVISRDVLNLDLNTLLGQDLSADYSKTTGTVSYDRAAGKAVISNVKADGSVTFSVDQAKDLITFVANTDNDDEVVLSMATKEMPGNANTYGSLATAKLAGYEFLGWYDAPVGGEKVTAGTAYTKGDSATVLYAHWQARTDVVFTVKHFVEYAEGGVNMRLADGVETVEFGGKTYYLYETKAEADGESDEAKDLTGKTLTVADMTEAECSWWTRNGFTAVFDEPYVVSPKGDSVFAVMYDRNVYAVKFTNNGVEGSEAKVPEAGIPDGEVKFGDNYGEMPVFTLPGYEFAGWYDDNGLVTDSSIHKVTDDVELVAHWNARKDTKWAIKVVTEDVAQYEDGEYYKPGTYSEVKTVYQDNDGELLMGTTDTEIEFEISSIDALSIDGFTYKGYADAFDKNGAGVTEADGVAKVYVKPTDMSTDKDGSYDRGFDGGVVYVYYTRDTVKVVFKDGQDEETEEEIVFGGDFEGKLPDKPGKDGYDFDHWVDPNGNTVDENTPADQYVLDGETVVVTPAWTARKYNLTYVPGVNGKFIKAEGTTGTAQKSTVVAGGYIDPNQVEYDQRFDRYFKMPTAAKVGYVFDGWQLKDRDGFVTDEMNVDITNVVISNAPIYNYEDTRPLYAAYTPHRYVLVLDAGKSSVTGEEGSVSPDRVTVTFDQAVFGLPTPTLRGYRFMGWVLKSNSDVAVKDGMVWTRPYTNGAEIPVKAIWIPENYRYTFNLNDQAGSTRGQLVDTTVDYVEETFDSVYDRIFAVEAIRPGYDFKGWSLTPDGGVLSAEDLVALSENRTLYAIWEPKLYDVKLVMKGGVIADLTDNNDLSTYDPTAVYDVEADTWIIKVAFDSVYSELPIPVKVDCVYHGYLADAPGWPAKEGYGVTVHEQVILALPQYIDFEDEDGITLTAVLEPYFTFDPDGGTFVDDGTTEPRKELQSSIDKLPDAAKDGYTHEGWQDGDCNPVSLEDVKNGEEPMELKPVYVANLTMDANGGTVDGESVKTVSMSAIGDKIPEPAREGYTFDGWYIEKAGGDRLDDVAAMKEANVPVTAYAHWVLNVTFDANGGTVNGKATDTVVLGTLAELPTATRSRYTFNGWFLDKTGGEKLSLEDIKALNEYKTVYAQWRYNGGGGGGGGTPAPAPVEIVDPETPLAGLDLLTRDHVAYVIGKPDGTVQPLADITRAEVAMIFYRLLTDDAKAMYRTSVHHFVDVDDWGWSCTAIATLEAAGILKGRGNGIFDPDAKITRAEFAAICARFDDLDMSGQQFSDVPETHWAYAEITSAAAKGWVKGRGNGTFGPDDYLTRAEAMTLINRVLVRAAENGQMSVEPIKGEGVKAWPDNMDNSAWYYTAVQEATHNHDHEDDLDKDGTLRRESWTEVLEVKVGNQ